MFGHPRARWRLSTNVKLEQNWYERHEWAVRELIGILLYTKTNSSVTSVCLCPSSFWYPRWSKRIRLLSSYRAISVLNHRPEENEMRTRLINRFGSFFTSIASSSPSTECFVRWRMMMVRFGSVIQGSTNRKYLRLPSARVSAPGCGRNLVIYWRLDRLHGEIHLKLRKMSLSFLYLTTSSSLFIHFLEPLERAMNDAQVHSFEDWLNHRRTEFTQSENLDLLTGNTSICSPCVSVPLKYS